MKNIPERKRFKMILREEKTNEERCSADADADPSSLIHIYRMLERKSIYAAQLNKTLSAIACRKRLEILHRKRHKVRTTTVEYIQNRSVLNESPHKLAQRVRIMKCCRDTKKMYPTSTQGCALLQRMDTTNEKQHSTAGMVLSFHNIHESRVVTFNLNNIEQESEDNEIHMNNKDNRSIGDSSHAASDANCSDGDTSNEISTSFNVRIGGNQTTFNTWCIGKSSDRRLSSVSIDLNEQPVDDAYLEELKASGQ